MKHVLLTKQRRCKGSSKNFDNPVPPRTLDQLLVANRVFKILYISFTFTNITILFITETPDFLRYSAKSIKEMSFSFFIICLFFKSRTARSEIFGN